MIEYITIQKMELSSLKEFLKINNKKIIGITDLGKKSIKVVIEND